MYFNKIILSMYRRFWYNLIYCDYTGIFLLYEETLYFWRFHYLNKIKNQNMFCTLKNWSQCMLKDSKIVTVDAIALPQLCDLFAGVVSIHNMQDHKFWRHNWYRQSRRNVNENLYIPRMTPIFTVTSQKLLTIQSHNFAHGHTANFANTAQFLSNHSRWISRNKWQARKHKDINITFFCTLRITLSLKKKVRVCIQW